jgi:SAM-dependent methyltransferase
MGVKHHSIFARVAERYRGGCRFARHYVPLKLRLDPVNRAILALADRTPLGEVTDIGCGYGQLGLMLIEARRAEGVVGLDCDVGSLRQARLASAGLPMRLMHADIRDHEVPSCDTVLLIDVLYQLESETQQALVERAAKAARARVLIRALDPARGWRTSVNWGCERVLELLAIKRSPLVNPRPISSLTEPLRKAGFAIDVQPCWAGTPFAGILVVAERYGR